MRLLFLLTYIVKLVWGQMYVRTDTTVIPLSSLDVDLIQCSRSCERDPACVGFFVDTSRCTNLAAGDYHPDNFVSFRKAGSIGSCPAGTKRWQMVFGTDKKEPKPDQLSTSGTISSGTTQGNGNRDSGSVTNTVSAEEHISRTSTESSTALGSSLDSSIASAEKTTTKSKDEEAKDFDELCSIVQFMLLVDDFDQDDVE